MIRIVADNAIPLLNELFSSVAEITALPGTAITQATIRNADALFVRTITPINQTLLQNSTVKFVGTMTAGTNHIDLQWLRANNIAFADARGNNANAVAEYVIACMAYLQQQQQLAAKNLRAAIIGMGHVGRRVAELLHVIGIDVVLNDPPRAAQDSLFISTPLQEIRDCDIVTLHPALTVSSRHCIDLAFLQQQKPGCILINTSRGEVLHPNALQTKTSCVDVWENEPKINAAQFAQATIATPHIAGYSLRAKLNASVAVYQAAKTFFQWHDLINPEKIVQNALPKKSNLSLSINDWRSMVLQAYNPYHESEFFKEKLLGNDFENLRQQYALRREFSEFNVASLELDAATQKILRGLGFNLAPS